MTTTPTLREAAQQALADLLEAGALDRADERITVLRAALAAGTAEMVRVGEDGEGQDRHCATCGANPGQMCSDEDGREHGFNVHPARLASVYPEEGAPGESGLRWALGHALSETFGNTDENGLVSIDPFDSDDIDALVDAVIDVLRERGIAVDEAVPVVRAELYVDAGNGLVGTKCVPVKSATWNDDGSLAVRIDYWPDPLASARMEPFGYVTIRRLSQRHENHADHYEFYPSGQSPYLDNVDDCIAVYKYHAAPAAEQQAEPAPNPSYPHITQPYTLEEIRAQIASHDYSAELLLQHAMLLLNDEVWVEPVAWPFRCGQRKLVRRGHAQGLLREMAAWMRRDGVGDCEAVELVSAYIDAIEAAPPAPAPTWPEWAEQILKIVREYSGYDGYDDEDGVDLTEEVREALEELTTQIERLEAKAPAPARQEWQPIETAPKTGAKIIVRYVNRNNKPRTVMARWLTDEQAEETDADGVGLKGGWYECIDNWDDYTEVAIHEGEPSLWMPIPAAPITAAPAEGGAE